MTALSQRSSSSSLVHRTDEFTAAARAPPEHPKFGRCSADLTNAGTSEDGRRPARIILAAGDEPCRIQDVSEGGAKLTTIQSSYWLPTFFDLEDVFSGLRRAVARVWSKHHRIGVRFLRDRS